MKDVKWLMVVGLFLMNFVFTGLNSNNLRRDFDKAREDYKKDLEDVYTLMKGDSSRLYTIMDTEVRILHYAKPHTHPMWACPECSEQKDREKLDESVQGFHRHKQGERPAKEDGVGAVCKE
jgi:hypothetical protein